MDSCLSQGEVKREVPRKQPSLRFEIGPPILFNRMIIITLSTPILPKPLHHEREVTLGQL